MKKINYWINEDKHSIAIANKLFENEEISNNEKISKKDILRAAKDFVKILRNETIDKNKIKETKERPNYFCSDLYYAMVHRPFELLSRESSLYNQHNDNDIEEYNNYNSFSYYNELA